MAARAGRDALGAWLRGELAPLLKRRGFTLRGRTFAARQHGNWALIAFQQSRRKDQDDSVTFTATLGISNTRVAHFDDPESGDKRPSIEDCHYTVRLGELLPDRTDKWWTLRATREDEKIKRELIDLIMTAAVPRLEVMSNDQALRDLWLSGNAPGLTALERLRYLSILLRDIGPASELERTLEQLRRQSAGKPSASGVIAHICRLGLTAR